MPLAPQSACTACYMAAVSYWDPRVDGGRGD
jgi:hypothetical protein